MIEILKQNLITYHFNDKKRYGICGGYSGGEPDSQMGDSDGGYVICQLDGDYDGYISCGVSDEESFTRDFLNDHATLNKDNSWAFDATIDDYPWEFTNEIQFIKENIDKTNDLSDIIDKHNNMFIKMDIEGGEFEWLNTISTETLNKVKQLVIEFHGFILGDRNFPILSFEDKINSLKKIGETHYIMHVHGNNHELDGVVDGIPHILELTFVNKRYFSQEPPLNTIPFPIHGLDYPNSAQKYFDFVLNKYPFCHPSS